MHVENQAGRRVGPNQAGQKCSRQKRLACAGFAENSRAPLGKPAEVEAYLGIHIERRSYEEIRRRLGAEDLLDVALARLRYRGEVSRHRLDRPRPFGQGLTLVLADRQHRRHVEQSEGGGAGQHVRDVRIVDARGQSA